MPEGLMHPRSEDDEIYTNYNNNEWLSSQESPPLSLYHIAPIRLQYHRLASDLARIASIMWQRTPFAYFRR